MKKGTFNDFQMRLVFLKSKTFVLGLYYFPLANPKHLIQSINIYRADIGFFFKFQSKGKNQSKNPSPNIYLKTHLVTYI